MAKNRIGKYTVYNLAEFRAGGIAYLELGVLGSGHKVVYRYLQNKFKLNFKIRRKFIAGTRIRQRLGRHPNIVWTLASGSRRFTPYELVDYVNGPSLQDALQQNSGYPRKHALLILYQLAQAIAHIHASGFLHLDIKANNIILDVTGVQPLTRLTDFDLSLSIHGLKPDKGLRYGTFNYMAPEHLTIGQIGPESDIFAYGVVAYNLFTTRMPYKGDTAVDSRKSKTDPHYKIPPIADFYPGINPDLNDCIMRALSPRTEVRYGAMKLLVRDLCEIIGPDTIRAYDLTSSSSII